VEEDVKYIKVPNKEASYKDGKKKRLTLRQNTSWF